MMFDNDKDGLHRLPRDHDLEKAHCPEGRLKCSLCGKSYDRQESRSAPFCSVRCQQIDLGHWLNEDYGFPVESGELPDESEEDA